MELYKGYDGMEQLCLYVLYFYTQTLRRPTDREMQSQKFTRGLVLGRTRKTDFTHSSPKFYRGGGRKCEIWPLFSSRL